MTANKETPRDFRRLIKRAEDSRELWKGKHHDISYDLKKARAIIDALRKSRDTWHDTYLQASSDIIKLKEDVKTVQGENKILQEEVKNLRKLEKLKKNP
jgi:uncharacterized coiled-coil DUF342 family protein